MPLNREPDYMWVLAWLITFAFTLVGIPLVAWVLRRRSRTRGAIRAYLLGREGVDAGPKAAPGAAAPRGHLTTDSAHAHDFVTAYRVPGARAILTLDDVRMPLTSRATKIMTSEVAADERTGNKVHRLAARAKRRDTRRGELRVNPEMGLREAALGSEPPMGWADWLPSDRVEYDVTRDSYLDDEGEYWPDAMRPLGDKQKRYRE